MTADLLGDQMPELPAMGAPLPWRVFYVNDYEWWVARTMDELREAYIREFDEGTWKETCEDAYELSDEALDSESMMVTDANDDPTGERITFRAHLEQRIAEGLKAPDFFCGIE